MNWESLYGGPAPVGILGIGGALLALVVVWTLVWKGLALWKAARLGSKPWFIVLLIVNTLGILDILYIYVFSRRSNKPLPPPPQM